MGHREWKEKGEGWSHDKAEIPEAETRGSQPGDAGLATRVYEYLSLNIKNLVFISYRKDSGFSLGSQWI